MTERQIDINAVEDANDIIFLVLGATLQLEMFFEAAEMRARSDASLILSTDDPLVVAALGLVSFQRSLKRWSRHAINDRQWKQSPPDDLTASGVSLR